MVTTYNVMSREMRDPFGWLVFRIDRVDRRWTDEVRLSPLLRNRIVRVLERCLAEASLIALYSSGLRAVMGTEVRYTHVPIEGDLRAILHRGIATLDDRALVQLALNPAALWHLHYCIVRTSTRSWHWAALMKLRPES